jgi:hypothetical protein
MATLYQPQQFTIQWQDVDTSQTLEKEFRGDIARIVEDYDPDAIWRRQNGEEMYMHDMADQHIINALRMCKRNLDDPIEESERYEYLLLEAIHRGLMNKDVGEWDTAENTL